MSLLRASAAIGSLTLLSRLLGFVRDMMIASFLGVGMLSDAFQVAFKIPNFMRQLFAEGAFNAAFVPMYAGVRATEGRQAAKTLAEEVHAGLLLVLVVVSLTGVIFMPHLLILLAPGFDTDPQKYNLTVLLTRITFPYILFISLVSLQGGILNSNDRFPAVAATPVIMNVCLITAMLLVAPFTPTTAHALAIGVMISGMAQYLWLFYFCRKAGVGPRLIMPHMTPNVRRLLTRIAPAALGSSVVQINLLINVNIASHIAGAVSILYYAVRIEELPFGVIGIAVSTALLPMLSRQIREGKMATALHTQNRALELSLLFGLPATIALFIIPYPIVAVIYQHGAFTHADTEATYLTLMAYALGLPAALAVKIFASTFYANQDTRTPVRIAIICVCINLFFNLALMGPLQYVGLALSTSMASWANALMLWLGLHKRRLFVMDAVLRFRLARITAASLIMGAGLWGAYSLLAGYMGGGLVIRVAALMALIGSGAGIYAAALLAFKVIKPSELKGYFRKNTPVLPVDPAS
jgi:putative peptidoglycan lipid II flippase